MTYQQKINHIQFLTLCLRKEYKYFVISSNKNAENVKVMTFKGESLLIRKKITEHDIS